MYHGRARRRRQQGQSLVILALALTALVAGTGLVVDVGFAWAEQRNTQNAADSAAKAGALVLARMAAEGAPGAVDWDAEVEAATEAAALTNDTALIVAQYADIEGEVLAVDNEVGQGFVPPDAVGVRAVTNKTPSTHLVGVVGINEWDIVQEATAVSGPTTGCLESVSDCDLLPVTFPVTVYQCSATGNESELIQPPQAWDVGEEITLPLCGGNPGSVGWLDWEPPNGGTDEIVDVVLNPPDIDVAVPRWHEITQTGGISSLPLEDAIATYIGEVVQVPMFASTCGSEPPDLTDSNCPTGGSVPGGGVGSNQWYFLSKILSFRLSGVYLNGNNEPTCGLNATQCLRGTFVSFAMEGAVGEPCIGPCPFGTTFAVQLFR